MSRVRRNSADKKTGVSPLSTKVELFIRAGVDAMYGLIVLARYLVLDKLILALHSQILASPKPGGGSIAG